MSKFTPAMYVFPGFLRTRKCICGRGLGLGSLQPSPTVRSWSERRLEKNWPFCWNVLYVNFWLCAETCCA